MVPELPPRYVYPFTAVLGIPPADILPVSKLGERAVATEVVGYQHLADDGAWRSTSVRSAIIASYALCGFAHFASLAIFVGGTGALAPSRIKDLSRIGFECFWQRPWPLMTAAVAGTFATSGSFLFGH